MRVGRIAGAGRSIRPVAILVPHRPTFSRKRPSMVE